MKNSSYYFNLERKKKGTKWKKYCNELEMRTSENLIQIIIFYWNFRIVKINNFWGNWVKMLDENKKEQNIFYLIQEN